MELVYLWVEGYKNIKKQGFNFSPRFSCDFKDEYDEEGNLKDDCELVICDKKKKECKDNDYIENFFGDNINVTAIVGKNGSGKSSIQKLIFLLIFLKKYELIEISEPRNYEKENSLIKIFQDEQLKDKNIFLIINTLDGLKKISFLGSIMAYSQPEITNFLISSKKCCLNEKLNELKVDELNFFSMHFHYMIDTWYDNSNDAWTNSIYHRVDGYDTPLLLEPYKGHEIDNNYINISNIEYLNNGKIFDFYGQLKENQHINRFFHPTKIWMMIDANKIIDKYQKLDKALISDEQKNVFQNFIDTKVKDKNLIDLNKLYLAIKMISSNKNIFRDSGILTTIQNKLLNINNQQEFQQFINELEVSNLLKKTDLPETQKIEACLEFDKNFNKNNSQIEKYKMFLVLDKQSTKVNILKEVFDIFSKIPPWIYIEFYEDKKSFSSLSSGEKIFLSFVINMMYQIRNIEKLENAPYTTINLFLDEVESGMHPDWQKRFLQEVFLTLENFHLKFNIIYATHSPFILSDLPKENIIFLKDGKHVKGTEKKQTFGANIHTLLSDSFFMEDGLMGEFAKDKIDEVIQYLNGKEDTKIKSDDEAQKLVNIIGEPIVKNQLQRMLDSKRLKKVDEIDAIKKSMKEMQKRLDELEK